MTIFKIILLFLIILFILIYYISGKQAKKAADKRNQLIKKIKNRERE